MVAWPHYCAVMLCTYTGTLHSGSGEQWLSGHISQDSQCHSKDWGVLDCLSFPMFGRGLSHSNTERFPSTPDFLLSGSCSNTEMCMKMAKTQTASSKLSRGRLIAQSRVWSGQIGESTCLECCDCISSLQLLQDSNMHLQLLQVVLWSSTEQQLPCCVALRGVLMCECGVCHRENLLLNLRSQQWRQVLCLR